MVGEKGRAFMNELTTKTYLAELYGTTQTVAVTGLKSRDKVIKDEPEQSFMVTLDPSHSDCAACEEYKGRVDDAKFCTSLSDEDFRKLAKEVLGNLS